MQKTRASTTLFREDVQPCRQVLKGAAPTGSHDRSGKKMFKLKVTKVGHELLTPRYSLNGFSKLMRVSKSCLSVSTEI